MSLRTSQRRFVLASLAKRGLMANKAVHLLLDENRWHNSPMLLDSSPLLTSPRRNCAIYFDPGMDEAFLCGHGIGSGVHKIASRRTVRRVHVANPGSGR